MVRNVSVIDPFPGTPKDAIELSGVGGVCADGLTAWAHLIALEGGERFSTLAFRSLVDLSAKWV